MGFLSEHSKSQFHSSLELLAVNAAQRGDYISGEIFSVNDIEINALYRSVNYSRKSMINPTSIQNIHYA